MRPSTRAPRAIALALLTAALLGASAGTAAADPTTTLVPIGSDYQPDTLQLFANEASDRSVDNQVHILVLPITYSLSAESTTKSERKKNLTFAENRRNQINTACIAVKTDPRRRASPSSCQSSSAPTRSRSIRRRTSPPTSTGCTSLAGTRRWPWTPSTTRRSRRR